MVKRKLDGAVDKSAVDRKIRKSDTPDYIYTAYEKSGGLHLAEPSLMAG